MQYTTAIVLAITGFATAQSTTTSSAATPSIYSSHSGCEPSIDTYIRHPLPQSKAVSNKEATDSSPRASSWPLGMWAPAPC
jgi:hypothetical protein